MMLKILLSTRQHLMSRRVRCRHDLAWQVPSLEPDTQRVERVLLCLLSTPHAASLSFPCICARRKLHRGLGFEPVDFGLATTGFGELLVRIHPR